jgi:hypothetical protein
MYDGEWYEDEMHGKGTETWEEGRMKYTGEF